MRTYDPILLVVFGVGYLNMALGVFLIIYMLTQRRVLLARDAQG